MTEGGGEGYGGGKGGVLYMGVMLFRPLSVTAAVWCVPFFGTVALAFNPSTFPQSVAGGLMGASLPYPVWKSACGASAPLRRRLGQ